MSDLKEIDARVVAALASALAKVAKARRGEIPAGFLRVDQEVTLRCVGEVLTLEDGEQTPTSHIPTVLSWALFIHHAGITGDAAVNALVKAMTEAIEISSLKGDDRKEAEAKIGAIADLDAAMVKVKEAMKKLPKKPRKGAVRPKAVVKAVPPATPLAVVESLAAK
tara:strand:+ start:180 stop:677 length:498 start_codon:yes stop_codon:yes gene_type:complete